MKYLIIFLTLPFLLCADQEERPCVYEPVQDDEREFETSWEHSDDCPCRD